MNLTFMHFPTFMDQSYFLAMLNLFSNIILYQTTISPPPGVSGLQDWRDVEKLRQVLMLLTQVLCSSSVPTLVQGLYSG